MDPQETVSDVFLNLKAIVDSQSNTKCLHDIRKVLVIVFDWPDLKNTRKPVRPTEIDLIMWLRVELLVCIYLTSA